MARCKFGAIVQSIVGTVSGVTFKGGACGGVVTNARRKTANNSAGQAAAQRVLVHHAAQWAALGVHTQGLWDTQGVAMSWPRAGGGVRHPTGKELFLWATSMWDPDGTVATDWGTPVVNPQYTTPIISAVAFHVAGPCNLTISNPAVLSRRQILFVDRHLEYGSRNAAGRHVFVGFNDSTAATINWYAKLAAAGVVLMVGERLGITIWEFRASWPSAKVSTDTVVLA